MTDWAADNYFQKSGKPAAVSNIHNKTRHKYAPGIDKYICNFKYYFITISGNLTTSPWISAIIE